MKDSRVLILDIETTPLEVYTWGIGEQHIALNQIKKDWAVIAWAAKWLGDAPSHTIYRDQRKAKNLRDDRAILKELWVLLNQADIVVTQNGKRFDSRRLNARFILLGMKPPKPYEHLDTYQILSRIADFTSDKLEYYTDKINKKYKKLSHKKFPGMELWKQCIDGNHDAWEAMKKYNIHDVLATEELYLHVRGWAPKSAPAVYHVEMTSRTCEVCGEDALERGGYKVSKKGKFVRTHCQACGAWRLGEKVKPNV